MWHSHDQAKMNRITSVPDEFALETRLVVLNFMGLMPASCPPTAMVDWPPEHSGHRHSLNGRYSSLDQSDVVMQPGTSQSNVTEDSECGMKTSEDQSVEPCTLIRKGTYVRLLTTGDLSCGSSGVLHSSSVVESGSSAVNGTGHFPENLQDLDAPSVSITPASPPEAPEHHLTRGGADVHLSMPDSLDNLQLFKTCLSSEATEESVYKSLNGSRSKRSSVVSCRLSPHPEKTSLSVDRQYSLQSCLSGSTRSLASLRRNSYVDVRHVDVQTLVRAQTLSPVAVSLKEEVSKGIMDLEKSYAHARTEKPVPPATLARRQSLVSLSGLAVVVSPQSQVADMLRAIGDRVQDDYNIYLTDATDQLLQQQYEGRLTYDALQAAAVNLLHHSAAGWTQVALVLLMSQRLSLTLLEQGDRSVGKLAEYTSRFITDHIADFILSRGGWQSIAEIGVTETPLSLSQDLLLSSSIDAALDQVGSVLAPEVANAGIEDGKLAAVTGQQHSGKTCNNDIVSCSTLQTVSPSVDENLTQPVNSEKGRYCLTDSDKDLFLVRRESNYESEAVNESPVLESFLFTESDELRFGLFCGVIAVLLFGTWFTYNRVKKG